MNSGFVNWAGPAAPLWVAPQYHALFARRGLHTLDDVFALSGADRFDKPALPAWRARLAIDLPESDGATRRFYVKRFAAPPPGAQRRRVFAGHGRRSTAGVERYWLEALNAEGIAVPAVAAFGEEMDGRRERRSVLVLTAAPGCSLEQWVQGRVEKAPPALIEALAAFIAGFHERGYIHRDLYLSHIFVERAESAAPRLTLIDLQRVLRHPLRRERWICRELAQLDYSTPPAVAGRRERLRFLKRYLHGRSLREAGVRTMIRRIARKSARIAAHDARRRGRERQ